MRKATDKQKLFVKAKVENPGISNQKAALMAGYSKGVAKNAGTQILEKTGVQALIDKLASDDILGQKLNEGLDSYKVDITGDRSPDFRTRLDYVKEITSLKGYRQQPTPDNLKRRIVAEEFFEGGGEE